MSNIPSSNIPNIPSFPREEWSARYKVFRHFGYDDQYTYYLNAISRNREAAGQVNRLRAISSLLTGLASAMAGLIVQLALTGQNGACFAHGQSAATFATAAVAASDATHSCAALEVLINILLVLSVLAPAIGGGLNILSDLYQWDRLTSIFDSSQRNMKVAYSRVPEDDMPDAEYALSVSLFTSDTLDVMYEEAGQWGQSLHSPAAINSFLSQSAKRASDASEHAGNPAAVAGDSMASAAMSAEANAAPVPTVSAQFAAAPVPVPTAPAVVSVSSPPAPSVPVVPATAPVTPAATPITSGAAPTTPVAAPSPATPATTPAPSSPAVPAASVPPAATAPVTPPTNGAATVPASPSVTPPAITTPADPPKPASPALSEDASG